ncbi:unknown [Corallococcus sp. CAG:1435]|nr:unknown [Corallococcus sp. CAG:1435]
MKFSLVLGPCDETFVQKEHFHVGGEQIAVHVAFLVGEQLVGVTVTGVAVIVFQFFPEQFRRLLEVLNDVGVGIGNVFPFVGKVLHHCVFVNVFVHVVFQNGSRRFDKGVYSCTCGNLVLGFKGFLLFFRGCLCAIFLQTDDIGGIDCTASRVGGVKVHIQVEQHVLHCERRAVGKLYVVFQHKVVGCCLVHVGRADSDDFQILCHHRFVVAVHNVAVFVVTDHAYLRHADNVAVRCGCGKEGIEHLVHFLRGKHQLVRFVVVILFVGIIVAGSDCKHKCRQHHYCQYKTDDFCKSRFCSHLIPPNYFP